MKKRSRESLNRSYDTNSTRDDSVEILENSRLSLGPGKQITELESTNLFAEGDLLLTRKTSSGTDKKINYTDFVESIGNPAIEGFIAIKDPTDANTVILTSANNALIPRYFVGMKISFVSPLTSTGSVKIKLGNLAAKDFVQYQTNSTVILKTDDYCEGVLISDKFHRINDLRSVANIYSNEYSVILTTIDPTEEFTVLNLVSSIGIPKLSYYDGMAISFIAPENTKGVTQISIDNISGLKTIFEPDPDDFISLPLYANQIVRAIYKQSLGGFIKDNFKTLDPKIDPAPKSKNPTEEEVQEGIIPDSIIPIENNYDYTIETVSSGPNSFTEFDKCIDAILTKFPANIRSGLNVTVTIKKKLVSQTTFFTSNTDLSWITLCSENDVIIFETDQKYFQFFTIKDNGSFFSIKKGSTVNINCTSVDPNVVCTFITAHTNLNITFEKIVFNALNIYTLINSTNTKLNLIDVTAMSFKGPLDIGTRTDLNMSNCKIKNWLHYAITVRPLYGLKISITNSDLRNSTSSSIYDIRINQNTSADGSIINQTNTKAKCSYNGTEMLPNSAQGNVAYAVVGGQ